MNGNNQTTIIQLNTSNSDFMTKKEELLTTLETNKADIGIISESNTGILNQDKTNERLARFKHY